MSTKAEYTPLYLFAKPSGVSIESSNTVFHKASSGAVAQTLCKLFRDSFGDSYEFSAKPVSSIPTDQQILYKEALDLLVVYSDPDPGVYDPEPSKQLHQLAQFAVQADAWEELIARQNSNRRDGSENHADQPGSAEATWQGMSADERRNSGLILFWMLAQAYYKLLEEAVSRAHTLVQLDLNLNQSYMWVVKNLSNLLKNHPDLCDFPVSFKPIFNDLYPSTIMDMEWEDSVGAEADEFLSTAQRYITEKGINDPPKGSAGYAFIELFRPSIEQALESAAAYSEKIRRQSKRFFRSAEKAERSSESASPASNTTTPKRFRVALSFAGERRYFVEEVAKHLAAAFGNEKILYDKYHEAELACVDLDVHLQNLYHNESELIVLFLCSRYSQKGWCGLEWRALRDLIKQKAAHVIMPFRFDGTRIPGLFSTDGYIAVEYRTPRDIANLIIKRLEINACSHGA